MTVQWHGRAAAKSTEAFGWDCCVVKRFEVVAPLQ
jgi:hypothetical protein